MQIWRVNMKMQTVSREETPDSWQHLGGRGLIAKIMVDEGYVAKYDPMQRMNKKFLRIKMRISNNEYRMPNVEVRLEPLNVQ